jgi:hypothetical protein
LRSNVIGSLDVAHGGYPTVAVGNDDIPELLGLLGVVRHQHCWHSRGDDHFSDEVPQFAAHGRIERGERFIEQYQCGVASEATGQGYALALAARQ